MMVRTMAERALLLVRADIGLINKAVLELAAARSLSRRGRVQLGDLYLRKGLAAEARRTYRQVTEPDWTIRMRLGLCDWAEGDFAGAVGRLESSVGGPAPRPEPAAYLALLHAQLGHYAAAREVLSRLDRSALSGGPVGQLVERIARSVGPVKDGR